VLGDITLPGLGIEVARAQGAAGVAARGVAPRAPSTTSRSRARSRERVNVDGTRNLLEFAGARERFERLQYVSTAYVSGRTRGVFRETDLDVGQGFKNHYEETKFLAEVEVVRSKLPATIYRPGVVVGDSRTGETAKFDGPYAVLRMMERLPSPGRLPARRHRQGHGQHRPGGLRGERDGGARAALPRAAA
jgi:nucleoside-diphosphate-sugar epimerase